MALDLTLSNALSNAAIRVFFSVRIQLPNYDLRLIESSGTVSFTVDGSPLTFTGKDAIFGTIASIGNITEAVATSAPTLQLSLLPPTTTAAGELAQPEVQGSPVRVWFGLVSEETGLVIGSPELVWTGVFDTAAITNGDTRVVDLDIKSSWERLFQMEEGQRLNGVWHRSIHPDDDCLDQNTSVSLSQPWGLAGPAPTAGQQPGGGLISGGGGQTGFDVTRGLSF